MAPEKLYFMVCVCCWSGERVLDCLIENWLGISFLSCKAISVLVISCVRDIIEQKRGVLVEEDVEERGYHELIEE